MCDGESVSLTLFLYWWRRIGKACHLFRQNANLGKEQDMFSGTYARSGQAVDERTQLSRLWESKQYWEEAALHGAFPPK